jgi:hypothetical protein
MIARVERLAHTCAISSAIDLGRGSDSSEVIGMEEQQAFPAAFAAVMVIFLVTMLVAIVWMAIVLVRPWTQSYLFGLPVSFLSLLGMRLRGTPPTMIIDAYVVLRHAGINITPRDVELVYTANRDDITSSNDLIQIAKQFAKDTPDPND